MPALLARLGPFTDAAARAVYSRRQWEPQALPPELHHAPEGEVVLLVGAGPPWQSGSRVVVARWPPDLPDAEALWAARTGRRRAIIEPLLSSRGNWVVDNRGVPCEIGYARTGAPVAFVLNYAGWRIGDFPRTPVEVVVCATKAGDVWLVTPDAVPEPVLDAAPPIAALDVKPVRPTRFAEQVTSQVSAGSPDQSTVGTRQPPTVLARPFVVRLRFVDISFTDGACSFQLEGRAVVAHEPLAREVYNAVRVVLDEQLLSGVLIRGTLGSDGAAVSATEGFDCLADVFERAQFRLFIRQSCAAPAWLDAGELARRRPGGVGRPDPGDLLDIPEFGLAKREEAFRRLFAHRAADERVSVLPGRAVIVPIPPGDQGPRWYAWETVADDHATYLFRPPDDAARERMLAWTQDPSSRRRELLDDKALQTELGYVRRVLHQDQGDDPLGSWWRRLRDVVGLRS